MSAGAVVHLDWMIVEAEVIHALLATDDICTERVVAVGVRSNVMQRPIGLQENQVSGRQTQRVTR